MKELIKDLISKVIAFEDGEMTELETINFFQELVDTGLAWSFQGFYVRTAMDLIEKGLVKPPKKKQKDYYGNVIQFPNGELK